MCTLPSVEARAEEKAVMLDEIAECTFVPVHRFDSAHSVQVSEQPSVQEKLQQATDSIDTAFVKTRKIEKRLRRVEAIETAEAEKLLGKVRRAVGLR